MTYLSSLDNNLPAGSIIIWPTENVPDGYLECDGSSLSQATYADLYSEIGDRYGSGGGNFNIPDYRGYFLRGWDHGAGNDPDSASRTDRGDTTTGDNVGTKQADELESHRHDVYQYRNINQYASGSGNDYYNLSSSSNWDVVTGYTGGNETRPKNINVMWCIKY